MAKTATAALRKLPSVDEVLRIAAAEAAIERFGRLRRRRCRARVSSRNPARAELFRTGRTR